MASTPEDDPRPVKQLYFIYSRALGEETEYNFPSDFVPDSYEPEADEVTMRSKDGVLWVKIMFGANDGRWGPAVEITDEEK